MLNRAIKSVKAKEFLIVIALALAQFAHIVDFVILMPLSPILMDDLGISTTQFATLVSSYGFAASLMAIIYAIFADRFDRKVFLIGCLILFTVGTFLCALSNSYLTLLGARIFAGSFGGILNSIVFAIVGDLIPYKRRGRALGIIMSAFAVASIVGIPIGLLLTDLYNWHVSFHAIGVLSILVTIFSIYAIPSVNNELEVVPALETLKSFKALLVNRKYLNAYTLIFVLALSGFSLFPFISPFLVKNIGITFSELKYVYLVNGLATIITARIIGTITDKVGAFKTFAVLAFFSMVPIYVFTHLSPMPLTQVLFFSTFFTVIVSGRFIPCMTFLTEVPSAKDRGRFMAFYNSVQGFGSASAAIVGGLIITETKTSLNNFDITGYMSIALTMVAIIMSFILKKKQTKKESKELP